MELASFNIGVSYMEPGSHRTPIWERSRRVVDAIRAKPPALGEDRYGAALDVLCQLMTWRPNASSGGPRDVARAIPPALQSPYPRARYRVGKDTRARVVPGLLPAGLKERALAGRFRRRGGRVMVRLLPILGITSSTQFAVFRKPLARRPATKTQYCQ